MWPGVENLRSRQAGAVGAVGWCSGVLRWDVAVLRWGAGVLRWGVAVGRWGCSGGAVRRSGEAVGAQGCCGVENLRSRQAGRWEQWRMDDRADTRRGALQIISAGCCIGVLRWGLAVGCCGGATRWGGGAQGCCGGAVAGAQPAEGNGLRTDAGRAAWAGVGEAGDTAQQCVSRGFSGRIQKLLRR
jgi:hypothetical protein